MMESNLKSPATRGDGPRGTASPAMIEIVRAGLVESSHFVSLAVADSSGNLIAAWGDPELQTYMRSSAKPFQALPAVFEGAVDAAGFTETELALMCASHAGTDRHAGLAAGMLAKIGCTAQSLRCGIHTPYDQRTAEALARSGEPADALRNNCSGKHSGMLALARHLEAPLETYLEQTHPVQQLILKTFARMTDLPIEAIRVGTDGCSAPNFAVPLRNAAAAYARLMAPEGLPIPQAAAARRVVAAMTGSPDVISGAGRFDTELMRVCAGRVLSKGGAEGYQCVGIPADSLGGEHPALGLALKVVDGDLGHRASSAATLQVLEQLGALTREQRSALARFDERELRNLAGLPVGALRISPAFEFVRTSDDTRHS
jgi:L-asparaginase II